MSYPPQTAVQEIKQILKDEGITDLKSYSEMAKDVRFEWQELPLGIVAVLLIMVVPTEPGYALFSILNGWSHGWLQHFFTVYLVQEI